MTFCITSFAIYRALLVSEAQGKGFSLAGQIAHVLRQRDFGFNPTETELAVKNPQDRSVSNRNTFFLPAVHQSRRVHWILAVVLVNKVPEVDEKVCCLRHSVIRPGGEMELAHCVALRGVGLQK